MTSLPRQHSEDTLSPGKKQLSQMKAILSSAYFAPIQWYQKVNRYDEIVLEKHDNFIKQTFRNRCVIAAANGPLALTIPVERPSGGHLSKSLMKDIRISDHDNWRHSHWNALQSAYGESPFFEYYADDLRLFFEKKWTFLFDFNLDICLKTCELIDIEPTISVTDKYIILDGQRHDGTAGTATETPHAGKADGIIIQDDTRDFRDAIRPKHPLHDGEFSPRRYYQVYEQKHGFIPNLSILDLLFNMGPESMLYL